MFSKILVANRGEAALRVIRACKEMGIATVAVFSEADRESLHAALADQRVCIGPAPAAESYLNMDNILSAAVACHAEAIHPVYGFLSESPAFARRCQEENIVFIGPSAEVIAKMGDKDVARKMMIEAGVPVVPGSELLQSPEEALKIAERVGYPLLLKARAGGGGKGIRRVDTPLEMETAYVSAAQEAQRAFGDGGLYLEKFVSPARHVEVQLLADEQGSVICLGERECSIQNHNQKLLEESPAPSLTPSLREKMEKAALKAARAVGYTSAGTVEFLLDDSGNFYFMEMNTRLQVEHGVTEQVSGLDIVKWQIRIAAGVPLHMKQQDVRLQGASIECRINAGGCGRVEFYHVPGGPSVRFDSALYQGYTVPPYYDAMLGKLVVHAPSRQEAIRKMRAALCELVIQGVPENIDQQISILNHPDFQAGNYDTGFLSRL